MTRRWAFVAMGALCVPLLAGASAAAQSAEQRMTTIFRFIDRDGDGFIDPGEFRRVRTAQFDRADRDRDGKLTASELAAMHSAARARTKAAGATVPDRPDRSVLAFKRLDRNGDARARGVVDRDEFVAGGMQGFTAADRDKDGKLSRPEWAAMAAALDGAAARRGPDVPPNR